MKYRLYCGPIGWITLLHKLIAWHARRMTIKNTIKNAFNYFHMEASSATVSMKLNPDLQSMLTADGLCRIFGTRISAKEDAKAGTPCVCGCRGQNRTFILILGRQADYLCLLRLVTPNSLNPSFGWMITTTDTDYLKLYCVVN